MHRFWSLLFFSVPVLGTLVFVWAMLDLPPFRGHWMPENINTYGIAIDELFYFILILTGIVFIGTGILFAYFMWRYAERPGCDQAKFSHGNRKVEIIWSAIPGVILLFLSFYQIGPWVEVTMNRPTVVIDGIEQPMPPLVRVTGRQFNWDFQYAGPDGEMDTADDLIIDTVFAVPMDQPIVLQLESTDVLHSFAILNMRVKQDVVPGMSHFVWFHATKQAVCEIACTELCGWGHYRMRANMLVLPADEYKAWMDARYREQFQSSFENASRGDE